MVIWHLKQTGKVKKLGKWVPHELTEIQNIVVLKCQLLLFYATNNNEWFLDQIVTCDKKWIIYGHQQWPIQWLDWEEAPKYFPKPNSNLHQKRSWSLFGGLLHIRSTTAFWILAKSLHLRSMLSKSMRCRWKPQLFNRMGPILHNNVWLHVTQPRLHKLNKLSYKVLFHLPYSPDRSPTNYHFFKHLDNFLQGKCFHNQQEAENAFQDFVKFQKVNFYATGINKLVSHC